MPQLARQNPAQGDPARWDLIVVGSGITGLMTAYEAARSGYRVAILSKSPDPRNSGPNTRFEAATWDGFINRFITLAEGHPYLSLPPETAVTHGEVAADFQRSIAAGGLLAQPYDQWDAATQQFLQLRQACDRNQDDNLQLFQDYLDENRTSLARWYKILAQALQDSPELLPQLALHTSGIDRLYTSPQSYGLAHTMQQAQGILKHTYPDLAQAIAQGMDPSLAIYGRSAAGSHLLTQYGVAFDVQVLGRQWLLPALERLGVQLGLGPAFRVTALHWDDQHRIQGLQTEGGHLYQARHYVLHPGAYGEPALLAQTPAQNRLAGVKGLWLRLKRADQLLGLTHPPRPCKIHGPKAPIQYQGQTYPGQVTDLNVMAKPQDNGGPGWDLVIGSGYLFQGFFPWPEPDSGAAEALVRSEALALGAIVQVVNQVYGLDLDLETVLADGDPRVDRPSAGCLRSWSPDDRELRELLPTATGGVLIIHGGGNTGSTTKAPFISRVACRFLQKLDAGPVAIDRWAATYESLRQTERTPAHALTPADWTTLEQHLTRLCQG